MTLMDITGLSIKDLMDFDTIVTMNEKDFVLLVNKSDFSNFKIEDESIDYCRRLET